MPKPDATALVRRDAIVTALRAIVPEEGVISESAEWRPYDSDGLTAYRHPPMAVVLPETLDQDSAFLSWCSNNGVKVVPRGAGTSLPGVTNLVITYAVEEKDFYYAHNPSNQIACTIGGNVAENSGGVHCLKYGLTTTNVLGIERVTIDDQVMRFDGRHLDAAGLDLLCVLVGSEGSCPAFSSRRCGWIGARSSMHWARELLDRCE